MIFVFLFSIVAIILAIHLLTRSPSQGSHSSVVVQDHDTVKIVNYTSDDPLHVYIEYANHSDPNIPPTLNPPDEPWTKIAGGGDISKPYDFGGPTPDYPANDAGASTWQIIIIPKGDFIILNIPNFPGDQNGVPQAWSIRPLKYIGGQPCTGKQGACGSPSIIECNRGMVCDLSYVDGANYLTEFHTTNELGEIVIDVNTNPCRAIGANPTGCVNPWVDGLFKDLGTACVGPRDSNGNPVPGSRGQTVCPYSEPCNAGTCNLIEDSKAWCDAITNGQCANSTTVYPGLDHPPSCTNFNKFTSYCYAHNDAASSPRFAAPYKIMLIYRDLV